MPLAPDSLQLDLFSTPASSHAETARVFVCGVSVDRTGIARYVHLIRGAHDPERSPRPPGGRRDRQPHLTLSQVAVGTCETHILDLLADGTPRTFNAIGVELLDHTADTLLDSPYDLALWRLVANDQLEHTLEAPILFRRPVAPTQTSRRNPDILKMR